MLTANFSSIQGKVSLQRRRDRGATPCFCLLTDGSYFSPWLRSPSSPSSMLSHWYRQASEERNTVQTFLLLLLLKITHGAVWWDILIHPNTLEGCAFIKEKMAVYHHGNSQPLQLVSSVSYGASGPTSDWRHRGDSLQLTQDRREAKWAWTFFYFSFWELRMSSDQTRGECGQTNWDGGLLYCRQSPEANPGVSAQL